MTNLIQDVDNQIFYFQEPDAPKFDARVDFLEAAAQENIGLKKRIEALELAAQEPEAPVLAPAEVGAVAEATAQGEVDEARRVDRTDDIEDVEYLGEDIGLPDHELNTTTHTLERVARSGMYEWQMYNAHNNVNTPITANDYIWWKDATTKTTYQMKGSEALYHLSEIDLYNTMTLRWDEILDAATTVNMISDTTLTDDLNIGTSAKRWDTIDSYANEATLRGWKGSGTAELQLGVTEGVAFVYGSEQVVLQAGDDIRLLFLPSSDPSVADALFTQTATQLGGSGSTKVLCVS